LDYNSNLPTVTDFAFSDALRAYLSGEKNIYPLYETLTQDIVYSDPDNLLTFMDNHDISRAMFVANGNVNKIKIALTLLFFTRGIPVLLYGTEIGIMGGNSDGELRQPFPGGFEGDKRSAFSKEGRGEKENEIFNYLSALLKIRKQYPVLANGKLRHIYTGSDLYLLVKTYEEESALVILNTGEYELQVPVTQLKSFLNDFNTLRNIKTGYEIDLRREEPLTINGFVSEIYLLEE
jgi:glycosidase